MRDYTITYRKERGGELKIHFVEREDVRTSKNLIRHELIGLEVKIILSPRTTEIGLQGIVVNETKNTLTIQTTRKIVIEKKSRTFRFKVGQNKLTIEGTGLIGRPEDRLKIKIWKSR
ncbi:MAG: ribonuclease P protein component 1 [Candidatus Heimdallarchaeota archaeon]